IDATASDKYSAVLYTGMRTDTRGAAIRMLAATGSDRRTCHCQGNQAPHLPVQRFRGFVRRVRVEQSLLPHGRVRLFQGEAQGEDRLQSCVLRELIPMLEVYE